MLSRRSHSLIEQDPDVLRHRHDHLAEVLRLPVLARGEVDLAELGDAVDQGGDLVPELPLHVIDGGERVLDHVVQQARAHAGRVEPELGDDTGYARRVDEVGVPALAGLLAMRPLGIVVGPLEVGRHPHRGGTREPDRRFVPVPAHSGSLALRPALWKLTPGPRTRNRGATRIAPRLLKPAPAGGPSGRTWSPPSRRTGRHRKQPASASTCTSRGA